MVTVEPEREMVRNALPFFLPAAVLALVAGTALGGLDAGWSAAIGGAVVALNFVAQGLSLARAARSSLVVLASVAVGGVIVRLAAIVGVMAILNTFAFFSPLACAPCARAGSRKSRRAAWITSGRPRSTMRPSFITTIQSETASASAWSWVT